MESESESPKPLTESQGHALVSLARQTLLKHFKQQPTEVQIAALERMLADPALKQICGVFVTLKKEGQLRGCIGTLEGREPLTDGVRSNSLNAAFHDPRFKPLKAGELDRIAIEISVLSTPQPLIYSGPDDLVAKLRPNVDGVTIRKDYLGATFLPQVWEQLPVAEEFLSHLCLKAGLSSNAWQDGDLEIETYQVQYFEELH